MEKKEKYLSKQVAVYKKPDSLPELFGRRRGFSNPASPYYFHSHNIDDLSIAYMDEECCKEFNVSLEFIVAMGADFLNHVIHPEDVSRIRNAMNAFVDRADEQEIFSYFQRVKFRPQEVEGYTLVITSAKLDIENRRVVCFSNTTDQLPELSKKISNALNAKYDIQQYAKQFLLLTKREKEILYLVAQGKKVKSIASELFISTRTVEQHKKNLYRKIEANSVAEVIAFASYFSNSS